jgi:hypothetical protein
LSWIELPYLKVPIALAMCAGFRKADVLSVTRSAVCDGMISVTTSKRQFPVTANSSAPCGSPQNGSNEQLGSVGSQFPRSALDRKRGSLAGIGAAACIGEERPAAIVSDAIVGLHMVQFPLSRHLDWRRDQFGHLTLRGCCSQTGAHITICITICNRVRLVFANCESLRSAARAARSP